VKGKNVVTVVLLLFVVVSVVFMLLKDTGRRPDGGPTEVVPEGAGAAAPQSAPSADPAVVRHDPAGPAAAAEAREGSASPAAAQGTGAREHVVVAYYFHGTARCVTCNRIEEYTKESLESAFAGLLEAGKIEFHSVDVQRPENNHFIASYRLTSPTTVLVDVRDGEQVRWKNLDRVWSHVRNKDAFMQYVQAETREYLEELQYE